MLLTIRTTHHPATDLGYLLGKNPARAQTFELPFGHAHVFYPEAEESACTAALLLEVDPVGLVRGRGGGEGALGQYVNDRPYVASSFLSVAIARVLRSALAGACRERPERGERVGRTPHGSWTVGAQPLPRGWGPTSGEGSPAVARNAAKGLAGEGPARRENEKPRPAARGPGLFASPSAGYQIFTRRSGGQVHPVAGAHVERLVERRAGWPARRWCGTSPASASR